MAHVRFAIPVYCPMGRTTRIGTGFLAERDGEVGLLTTARFLLGRQPYATGGWAGWPTTMLASVVPGEHVESIPLVVGEGGVRRATFSYVVRNPASGYLADMIGFFDRTDVPALERLADEFEAVALRPDQPPPPLGAELTVRGFPDRGGSSRWPYETSRKASGNLERIREDGVLEAKISISDGFRGAPTFTGSGDFVGMVCEAGGGICRIIPVEELLTLGDEQSVPRDG